MRAVLLSSVFALSIAACSQADVPEPLPEEVADAEPASMVPEVSTTTTKIINASDIVIGDAVLTEGPHGILLRMTLSSGALSPGWHGLHLHQVGDCSDVGTFKLSGGHVGKVAGGHGLLNPVGPEGGDIPNIWAAADGSAGYEAFTTLTSFEELLDEDGSAIIIHANPDDHITQPIGGAGPRVGCAVLK